MLLRSSVLLTTQYTRTSSRHGATSRTASSGTGLRRTSVATSSTSAFPRACSRSTEAIRASSSIPSSRLWIQSHRTSQVTTGCSGFPIPLCATVLRSCLRRSTPIPTSETQCFLITESTEHCTCFPYREASTMSSYSPLSV